MLKTCILSLILFNYIRQIKCFVVNKQTGTKHSVCLKPDHANCRLYRLKAFYCPRGWLRRNCCNHCKDITIRENIFDSAAGRLAKPTTVTKIRGRLTKPTTVTKIQDSYSKNKTGKKIKDNYLKNKTGKKIKGTPIAGCPNPDHLYCRFYKPKETYCNKPWVKRNCCYLCQVPGSWGSWNDFGRCSVTCGSGRKIKRRVCNSNSSPFGVGVCSLQDGSGRIGTREDENKICHQRPCPVDGNWGKWSKYDDCSTTCGGGKQARNRSCENPSPKYGGSMCLTLNGGRRLLLNEREISDCNVHSCPVDGNWGEWSNYGDCSLSCGGGEHKRTRLCNNPVPAYGGVMCLLSDDSGKRNAREKQTEICNNHLCPVDGNWGKWNDYGRCSVSCGGGYQSRSRLCNQPSPLHGGLECLLDGDFTRDSVEQVSRECNINPCPVNGNWGKWGDFSRCSATCGDGKKLRKRSCDNPPASHGGSECLLLNGGTGKSEIQISVCNDKACIFPVHGSWGGWSVFVSCSKTCGGGEKIRSRTCSNPRPANGGEECLLFDRSGNRGIAESDIASCNKKACPNEGGWGEWSDYSDCSVTCGGGILSRQRLCNKPYPTKEGLNCLLPGGSGERNTTEVETEECNTEDCPVHGNWGSWIDFISCSASCGGGDKLRSRSCDSPSPSKGGLQCLLTATNGIRDMYESQIIICNTEPCPGGSTWSDWSQFSKCSVSCGGGHRTRSRHCIGSEKSYCPLTDGSGGRGKRESKTEECNVHDCEEDVYLYSFATAECID